MWPLGTYDRMVYEIKHRENKEIPVTFGILIADYRQRVNREYILNYIERFNYKSDKYINFYLPGYLDEDVCDSNEKITIGEKEFFFNSKLYSEFLRKLEKDFDIDYPYIPMLLLIEYSNGHFSKSNKIKIELDNDDINIKKTGELFEKIFSIARRESDLKNIKNSLIKEECKSGLLNSIVTALDNSLITAIYDQRRIISKYKVV